MSGIAHSIKVELRVGDYLFIFFLQITSYQSRRLTESLHRDSYRVRKCVHISLAVANVIMDPTTGVSAENKHVCLS